MTMSEPIPDSGLAEIEALFQSGDLFRYTAKADAPVTLLEQDFAAQMGARYALAVSSCSAALFLSLEALDLRRTARVLIPAFTFAAVPSSVVHAGCIPVLCEVGENYRVDLDDFAIKLKTGIDAVIISHMRGHTSDMDAIMEICEAEAIPVIEDAAHSLGTVWRGRKIGTIGSVGCFSFQSYKMINAGEGGIMITDDAELMARAVIMSGAYEHNWSKHITTQDAALSEAFARWQNALPLYNLRMSNLSAVVVRAQLGALTDRVERGRAGHDAAAALLAQSPWIDVPAPLEGEMRAPDSIQFNLRHMTDDDVHAFVAAAAQHGAPVQVFGLSTDNARAFWNWKFLPEDPEPLPQTRDMLMRACDLRLPTHLTEAERQTLVDGVLTAITDVMGPARAYGT